MPIKRVDRRKDQKLLVLAGLGGLVLIAAPVVVFSQALGGERPPWTNTGDPAGIQLPFETGTYAAQPTQISPLPATSARLDKAGRLVVVARGQNHEVLSSTQAAPSSGSVTTGWVNLGGSAAGDPVIATNADGELVAFAIGTNGALLENYQVKPSTGAVANWRVLGGTNLVGMPAVAQDAVGKLVVVARAADGSLWTAQQTQPGGSTWTEWRSLPMPAAHDPALFRDSKGKLRIFAAGPDRQLRTMAQAGLAVDEWNAPRSLGGATTGPPAVAMDDQGSLRVFSLTVDGSLLDNVELSAASDTWRGWQSRGGRLMGRPLVVADPKGCVVVHVLTVNGTVQEIFQLPDRKSWSEWHDHAGSIAKLVASAQDSQGRLAVYGISKRGGMEQTYQAIPASGPWVGWESDLGGVFPTK
ncbi:hypothetical protein AB0H34_28340 [Saccharopolyspora shandongensis]|uniref:hypothetical protein n=1 Tax=Saccharopolyspora shandongensis TaxID=418495 RepID=UPI003408CD77